MKKNQILYHLCVIAPLIIIINMISILILNKINITNYYIFYIFIALSILIFIYSIKCLINKEFLSKQKYLYMVSALVIYFILGYFVYFK